MSKVIFNYKGNNTIVLCQENEKMIEICKRYGNKIQIDINDLYFLYNGKIINIELRYDEIANGFDKERKEVSILVINKNTVVLDNKKKLEFPICPECNENIILEIKDYKINLYDCKNKHNINNILINEYNQYKDLTKIECNNCKKNNMKYIIMKCIYVMNVI